LPLYHAIEQLKPHSQSALGVGASWRAVGMSWRDAELAARGDLWQAMTVSMPRAREGRVVSGAA